MSKIALENENLISVSINDLIIGKNNLSLYTKTQFLSIHNIF